ncbi:unnamed protein product [Peronospora farinosa]|uniref:Uncharacterized protein n=1 Tax=Peronospora farinosa TaxID=134698 RepID=A0ABN8C2J3_9STRA|nr:unnamed protein product [Peronospora farinosa]
MAPELRRECAAEKKVLLGLDRAAAVAHTVTDVRDRCFQKPESRPNGQKTEHETTLQGAASAASQASRLLRGQTSMGIRKQERIHGGVNAKVWDQRAVANPSVHHTVVPPLH